MHLRESGRRQFAPDDKKRGGLLTLKGIIGPVEERRRAEKKTARAWKPGYPEGGVSKAGALFFFWVLERDRILSA
jgi:hypothetical protein